MVHNKEHGPFVRGISRSWVRAPHTTRCAQGGAAARGENHRQNFHRHVCEFKHNGSSYQKRNIKNGVSKTVPVCVLIWQRERLVAHPDGPRATQRVRPAVTQPPAMAGRILVRRLLPEE